MTIGHGKLWEIVISNKVAPETRNRIREILIPILSTRRLQRWYRIHQRPPRFRGEQGICYLCGIETQWIINNTYVCPQCNILYDLARSSDELKLPSLCEVCGCQGEWSTHEDPIHSLCEKHRKAWCEWKMPKVDSIKISEDPIGWRQAWDETWAEFVTSMKKQSITE